MMPAEFGATPWGLAWLRTIESTSTAAPNALLPKARSIARNHAVTLTTGTGRVDADVAVSGAVHRVRIDVPPWPEQTRAEVQRLVAKALADNRGLAVGDLPDTLAADLRHRDIGIAVEPDERSAACDCRTRRRPCVHILATIYTLTQLIDERPVLAIELRSSGAEVAAPPDPDWIALTELDAAGFYGA
nr:Arm20 [uncultured bacterium]